MKLRKSALFRSAPPIITATFVLGGLAMLLPASLSAATTLTIGFDTDGDTEGFTAFSSASATFSVTTSSGFLTGTSPGGDPRIINTTATASSTPIVSKASGETWSTIVFRVRETDETPAVVTPWSSAGINVVLNSSNVGGGATVISSSSISAVDSGDGFFNVTADISAFAADDIRYLRFDPIGGGSTSDNNAAGNLFEVDFVQVNAVPEPTAMLLGSLGMLGLLRRRR